MILHIEAWKMAHVLQIILLERKFVRFVSNMKSVPMGPIENSSTLGK